MSRETAPDNDGSSYDGNYQYGNKFIFDVDLLSIQRSVLRTQHMSLARATAVSRYFYLRGLRDISQTVEILEGPKAENDEPTTVEIAIAQREASDVHGYDAHFSTGSSSIRNNKKQAAEHALRSAADTSRPSVYIASPGQGGSSGWTRSEAQYIHDTGRFVQPDGSPLPTMRRQYETLRGAGILVTRMSTDADGGVFGTAFGVAMEPGQLTNAHFNNLPISTKKGFLPAAQAELVNMVDDRMTAHFSRDPQRLTKEDFEEAERLMPDFSHDAVGSQATALQKARTSHTPSNLVTVSAGLARGGNSYFHPAVYDTARLIEQHPDARLTFQFPARAASLSQIGWFLEALHHHSWGKVFPHDGSVQAIAHPGTRRGHVSYPTLRQTIRDYAYGR